MKKAVTLIVASLFVITGFVQLTFLNSGKSEVAETVKIPKKVQAVIDKSCFGCHNEDSKAQKAKDKLKWDKFGEYDKAKLASVYDEIIETIEKKEMPPEKFLANKPEAKPTDAEYKLLLEWAEKEADKLVK